MRGNEVGVRILDDAGALKFSIPMRGNELQQAIGSPFRASRFRSP